MTQRIFNVEKWIELEEGQTFVLASDDEDKVRAVHLEVNAPDWVALSLLRDNTRLNGEVEQTFLASVRGRDKIEFYVTGTVRVAVEGGSVFIYTIDGEDISIEAEPSPVFTRILERRRRSPELEAIVREMNFNMERRFAIQAGELSRLVGRREEARAPLRRASGDSGGSRAETVSSPDADLSEGSASGDVRGSHGEDEL